MSQIKIKNKHTPVLLEEVLRVLDPKPGERYLDLTAGYGGHAQAVLKRTASPAVLVDRDQNAIDELTDLFGELSYIALKHSDFLKASKELVEEHQSFDLILADLGLSSPHLDNASRGFSLLADGPLDMRMDPSSDLSADSVVNTYPQAELERILRVYGEEPKARRMAELIVAARPIRSTVELANIAKKVWPGHSRTHPATRLFQAVRIAVNDELRQVEQALPNLVKLLNPGGRLVIITFHSLEDRIVKRFIVEHSGAGYDAELINLTPKPLTPSPTELVHNPRARSAKIRACKRK